MIESEDQESVVFLGRSSFRMQVVGTPALASSAGAIPSATWRDMPTERIVERRRSPRVTTDWGPTPPSTPKLPMRSVAGIASIAFACGVLAATTVDRLRPRGALTRSGQVEQPQPAPARATAVTPPPVPALAIAPIIQPLPRPAPDPAPVMKLAPVAAPAVAIEPRATARPIAVTSLTRTPRARTAAPAAHPRRAEVAPAPAPAAPEETTAASPTETDAVQPPPFEKPPAGKKWVDPFAE